MSQRLAASAPGKQTWVCASRESSTLSKAIDELRAVEPCAPFHTPLVPYGRPLPRSISGLRACERLTRIDPSFASIAARPATAKVQQTFARGVETEEPQHGGARGLLDR